MWRRDIHVTDPDAQAESGLTGADQKLIIGALEYKDKKCAPARAGLESSMHDLMQIWHCSNPTLGGCSAMASVLHAICATGVGCLSQQHRSLRWCLEALPQPSKVSDKVKAQGAGRHDQPGARLHARALHAPQLSDHACHLQVRCARPAIADQHFWPSLCRCRPTSCTCGRQWASHAHTHPCWSLKLLGRLDAHTSVDRESCESRIHSWL